MLAQVHGEQEELAERVPPKMAGAAKVQIKLGTFGKPQLQLSPGEIHRTVFDGQVFALELDCGQWLEQVNFEAQNLMGICGNPGASLYLDRKATSAHLIGTEAGESVGPLGEADLPGRCAAPLAKAFAGHCKIMYIKGVKD